MKMSGRKSAVAKPPFVADDGSKPPSADSWLTEALSELADADLEAEEEGYPPPGDAAKAQAEHILRQLAVTDPAGSAPAVSPTADGDIAVSFHNPESMESYRFSVNQVAARQSIPRSPAKAAIPVTIPPRRAIFRTRS